MTLEELQQPVVRREALAQALLHQCEVPQKGTGGADAIFDQVPRLSARTLALFSLPQRLRVSNLKRWARVVKSRA